MIQNNYHKAVYVLAFLIIGFFLAYIAYANIRDRGSLTVGYQFKSDSRIFGLYPSDRVSKPYRVQRSGHSVQGSEEYFQEMVASPVYLDVRYWQNFRKARVEVLYEKDPEVDFQIGYKVGKDFQWKLFPITEGTPLTNFAMAKNVRETILDIELTHEYVPRSNVHRWVFSSSSVQDLDKAIRIYGVKFTFTK